MDWSMWFFISRMKVSCGSWALGCIILLPLKFRWVVDSGWSWRCYLEDGNTTIITMIKRSTDNFIIIIIIIIFIIIPFIQIRMDYLTPNHSSSLLKIIKWGYGGLQHLRPVATWTACRCRGTPKLCNNTRPNEYLEGRGSRRNEAGLESPVVSTKHCWKKKWRKKSKPINF